MDRHVNRMQEKAQRWWGQPQGQQATSGNRAFDEYREETLRRLQDEQREFMEFLDRLRHAKDKAEFDEFISERRRHSGGPAPQPPQPETI